MKHVTLLLALLLIGFLNAQESFPYKRPELLINKEVTVKPMHPGSEEAFGGYENFYSDSNWSKIYKENNRSKTSSSSLTNRTFKVVSSEFTSDTPFPYHVFKLEDKQTKELIYYMYNMKLARNDIYPFTVVGGLDVPADFYCDYVETYGGDNPIYFIENMSIYKLQKKMLKGKAKYSLNLIMTAEPLTQEGIVVNLENNMSITRPDYPIISDKRTFGSFELTAKEIELLKNNKITGFTLGKTKGFIGDREAIAIKEGLKCLMSK